MLREALSVVREAIRESKAGSPRSALFRRFCASTGNAGIHEISSASKPCPLPGASACQGLPSELSTYFTDAPADQSRGGLAISPGVGLGLALSAHGPCLVGGTVTLDDVSFTTKIAIHKGGDAMRFTDVRLDPPRRVGWYAFIGYCLGGVRATQQPSFLRWF